MAARRGRSGSMPEWYADFDKQRRERNGRRYVRCRTFKRGLCRHWALDALAFGLRGVAAPPSSVAFALYAWARQCDENRKALIPFLIRCGCGQLTRISTPSGDRLFWEPIRNNFSYALETLERDGLAWSSPVSP